MSLGIKIRCPYPISLKGASMPNAFVNLKDYYIETKITSSDSPEPKVIAHKGQNNLKNQTLKYLDEYVSFTSHEIEVNLKKAGPNINIIQAAIHAQLDLAIDFYTRKYKPQPFDLRSEPFIPKKLFHSGKFSILQNDSVYPLPNPSGLHFGLVESPALPFSENTSDVNAFLLSEATYRLNFSALKILDIPSALLNSFSKERVDYLTLFFLDDTQNVLLVFQNTIQRDRFKKEFNKNYICHTELDLDGIIVI